jgi:hypothetical protein
MKRFNTNSTAGKVVLNTLLTSVLLLILSAFTLSTVVSAAELIVNGGFESPVVDTGDPVSGWMTYYGQNKSLGAPDDCPEPEDINALPDNCNDGTQVPGWDVYWTDSITELEQLTPGRLEIQSGFLAGIDAFEGIQKAELDSEHRVTSQGETPNNNVTITQFLPTCPLADYTLRYAWKSRTTMDGDNDLRVWVDTMRDSNGDPDPIIHNVNLPDWQDEEVSFTSDNSGQTLLLFGSIGTQSGEGAFLDAVSVTGPDCSLVCDEKPYDITLRYDGNDDTHHGQSGNEVVISPEVVYPFPDKARIEVFGHNKKKPAELGSHHVEIGELFSVSNDRPNKRIPPRLTFKIYNDDAKSDDYNSLVQTVTFHTSCSQPLSGGDEFGAITVWNALP